MEKNLLLFLVLLIVAVQCCTLSQSRKKVQNSFFLPSNCELFMQRIEKILQDPKPHLGPLYPIEIYSHYQSAFLHALLVCKSILKSSEKGAFWTGNIYQLPYRNLPLGLLWFIADRKSYEHIKGPPLDLLIAAALLYDLYPTKGGISGLQNWSEVILRCKLTMRLLPVRDLEPLRKTVYYMHYASAAYTIDWLLQVMQVHCSIGKLPKQMCLFGHELLRDHPTFAVLVKDAKIKNDSISLPPKSHPIYFWCLVAIFLYFSYCFYLKLF